MPQYPQQGPYSAYGNYKPVSKMPVTRYSYQESTPADNTAKTLGMAALLQGLALFLEKASGYCSYKVQNGEEVISPQNVQKIAQNMVNKNKLDVDVRFVDHANKGSIINKYGSALANELDIVASGKNAFFTQEARLAVAPASKPSLMPHELGHAINAQKSKFFGFLQKLRPYSKFAPTALLFASSLIPRKEGEKPDFIQRNAGVLGFASFLPTIIEEAAASVKGLKEARLTLGKAANLTPLKKNYFFAWLTYVIAGVGVGIAAKETMMRERN